MNFAILGANPAVWPILEAIRQSGSHRLTAAALSGELTDRLRPILPDGILGERWDMLLVDPGVDAVIVAARGEETDEAARRLASEGKPLLVLPRGDQAGFAYELSLARDDSHVPLVPLLPLRFETGIAASRESTNRELLGPLLHIQWQRRIPGNGTQQPSPLSLNEIEEILVADLDLLRSLGGNYDRVTTLQTGLVDGRAAMISVTLAGDGKPDATWTATPRPEATNSDAADPDWTLTLTGTNGRKVLTSAESRSQISLLLDAFAETVRGKPAGPTWNEWLRACETVDAARRSWKRRRTIDLHYETTSERSQFKTQMTAIGCGVLMLTLALVPLLMLIGSVFALPPAVMKVARIAVFAPLFLFLLLQLLIFVARPATEEAARR